ncbi:hypothetical protein A0O28_0067030 [Trichoderma guizhouense]|uniref:Metallo-beta-lactamase domain-containing protein n=1 Tax=Trichoderma guizhouense TaxID=1491466 RepID=A0A1T3CZU0_9HYPO|nr:hypothetical protein A0O28_0067030 [Trichoderma guizhouense]
MANPSPWKVVNYQIPVPIGDCSAHFLVDKLTGTVQRAFLMDGGTNAGVYAAWAQILKALRFIDLELGNDWKFDSWVVTHWDEDHFHGVKDLLVNNEIEFTRCNHNGAKVTRGSPGNFASLYFNPKPVLLCGAWDAPVMFKGGSDFLRLFVKDKPSLELWDSLKKEEEKIAEGRTLLRCIWGQVLIGLDLFTRSFYFDRKTGEVDYKASIYSISDGNDPTSKNTPRFCVVGANGYGIGRPDACKLKPSRNETSILGLLYWPGKEFCSYYTGGDGHPDVFKGPVQEWFRKHWPGGDVEMVKLDHHGSTGENLGKVPRAEDEDKKFEEEKPLPEAENKNFEEEKTPSEAESKKIEEEKAPVGEAPPELVEENEENLDTPDDLEIEVTNDQEKAMEDAKEIGIVIEYMKPSKVLVTPGTRHGHPTWDVLIILRSYFEKLRKVISSQNSDSKQVQGLFSTRSVYWFSKDEVSYKDINFNHVLGTVLQKRLEIAEKEEPEMLEEKAKQDPNDANKGRQDIEEEDYDSDPPYDVGTAQIADAPERAKAQNIWAKSKKAYVDYILSQPDSAKYYKKNGDRNWDAINFTMAKEIKKYDQERRQEMYDDELLKEGSEEAILYELVGAFWELIEATDDAQLEGVENFEDICWQPLVASAEEDPHFLIRFEFGEERKDTALKVFDANGQHEYEEGSTQSEKKETKQNNSERPKGSNKKGSIHEESKEQERIHEENSQEENIRRCRKTERGLITKDDHNPWTKHAYSDCDIATMLSAISLNTVADSKMAVRIGGQTGREFTKGDSTNMIYKYYTKRRNAKAGIEEMIKWNEQKRHGNTSRRIKEEIEKEKGKKKETEVFKKRITKREVKEKQKVSRGKDNKVTSRKGKKDKKGQP